MVAEEPPVPGTARRFRAEVELSRSPPVGAVNRRDLVAVEAIQGRFLPVRLAQPRSAKTSLAFSAATGLYSCQEAADPVARDEGSAIPRANSGERKIGLDDTEAKWQRSCG